MKKGVLRNFTKLTGKHLCQSLFEACNFIQKRLWHRCFPVNFAKFLRTPFYYNRDFNYNELDSKVFERITNLIKF